MNRENTFSLREIKALHGKNTLDLNCKEQEVLNYAIFRGRSIDVSVVICPSEEIRGKLIKAKSSDEYNEIFDKNGREISISSKH